MLKKLLRRRIAATIALSLIWITPGCDFYIALADTTEAKFVPIEKVELNAGGPLRPFGAPLTYPSRWKIGKILPARVRIASDLFAGPARDGLFSRALLFLRTPLKRPGLLEFPEDHKDPAAADVQVQLATERAAASVSRPGSLELKAASQDETFTGHSLHGETATLTPTPVPGFTSRHIEELRRKLAKRYGQSKFGQTEVGLPGNIPPAPPQKPPSDQNPEGSGLPKWPAWLAAIGLAGWVIFSGPIRYNPVISTLSFTGYMFGNIVGVLFPFPQVATTYKAQDATNVSLAGNLIPGIGALLLTLTAYYMEAPMRFLAAQNLFELFTFAAVLVLKGYYAYKQKKGSPDRVDSWFQKLSSRTVDRYNTFAEKLENKTRKSLKAMKVIHYLFTKMFNGLMRAYLIYLSVSLGDVKNKVRRVNEFQGKSDGALEKAMSPLKYRMTPESAAVWLKTIPTMILITALTYIVTFMLLPHAAPILQPWVRAHAKWLTIAAAILFGGFSLVSATKIERTKSSANVNAWPSWLFGSAGIGLGIFSVQQIMIRRAIGKNYSFPFIYLFLNIAGMATAVLNLITINKYNPQGADPQYTEKFFGILKKAAITTAVASLVILNSHALLAEISHMLLGNPDVFHIAGPWKSLWEVPAAGAIIWLLGALSWIMGNLIKPLPIKFAAWLDILIPWVNKKFPWLSLGEKALDFDQRLEFYKKNFGVHEVIRVDHGGDPVQRALDILSHHLLSDHNPRIHVLPWDIKGQSREIDLTEKILEEVREENWLVGLGPGLDLDNLAKVADEADRREGRNPQQLGPHNFGEASFSGDIYLIPVRDPNQNKKVRDRNTILKLSQQFGSGLAAPVYA